MQLSTQDLNQLYDLADEIEEHPQAWQSPRAIGAAIRHQAQRMKALIVADEE